MKMEALRINAQQAEPPVFKVGGHYCVDAEAVLSIDALLTQLPPFPGTIRVDRDGGLLSHLSVWNNLKLPLEYHGMDIRHVAEDAAQLFRLCGEDSVSLSRILRSYPDVLSSYEQRLAGFVRAMLLEPDVLVLDDVFDGLVSKEKQKVVQWERVFRWRFPFRVLLYWGQEELVLSESGHLA